MFLIKQIFTFIFFISFYFGAEVNAQDKFLSLKNSKVNVRYGPGFDYNVKYIYRKLELPLKIIDKKENFRRIIDFKKNSGWIHISQLKKSKSFIVLEDKILFKKPSLFSKPILKIKKGRLLLIKKCQKEWCKVKTEKYLGWLKTDNIWGSIN
jgi:SH3-like domain-containing protein